MEFADKQVKCFVFRLMHEFYYMPKFIEKYFEADNWVKRKKICEEAIEYFENTSREQFDKTRPFAVNLKALNFHGLRGKNQDDNILDLHSLLCNLNSLFELLFEYCNNKKEIKDMRFYVPWGFRDLIAMCYQIGKFGFSNCDDGTPMEIIRYYENKFLKLPNEK